MKVLVMTFYILLFSIVSVTQAAADEKKVVLQISDDSLQKQLLVLNVADNLQKHYGEDLQLEMVAFGPGIKLLLSGNTNTDLLQKLSKNGVRLSACRNTGMKMAKMLDRELELQQGVKYVDSGAVRVIELIQQGYILIRP